MKKVFILGLSAAVLAGGVMSCKKTSKGKMANEWTVASYNSEYTSTNSDGDVNSNTDVFEGTTMTSTYVNSPNGGTTSTSTSSELVSEWAMTIEKDGNWSSVRNSTTTELDSTFDVLTFEWDVFTVTENVITETSGIWNFVGKSSTEEFKANERVLFNVLTENDKTTTTSGADAPVTSTDKTTLEVGDAVIVYTVVESSSKELTFESVSKYTNVDEWGTYNSEDMTTMVLTQK